MRIEATLLGALLLSCTSGVIAAGGELIERCRTPPKAIIADSKYEYSPPSTAMPPVGTIILEITVTTDGTVRDASIVEAVDSKLERWAIEESKNLRFTPVSKACRTRLKLERRITDAADGA